MDLPMPYSVPPPKLDRPPPNMSLVPTAIPPPPVYKPPSMYTSRPPPLGPMNMPPPKLLPQPVPPPMVPPPTPLPPPPPFSYYPISRDLLPPTHPNSRCYSPSSAFSDYSFYSSKLSHSHAPMKEVKPEPRSWEALKQERDSSPSMSESSYRSVRSSSSMREPPSRRGPSHSREYYDRYRKESSGSSSHRGREYDRERRDRPDKYRSSRSPSSSRSHYSRSPPRYTSKKKHYKEMEREEKRKYYDRLKEYQQKREQLLKLRSPSYFKDRGISHTSHDRRYDELMDRPRVSRSHSRRPDAFRSRTTPPRSRHSFNSHKPLTDREKILEDYRKNFCKTSEDIMKKIEQWSREHDSEEEQTVKMWYRSSPAELYYKTNENGTIEQTSKLEKLCDLFFTTLIERGRKARPEVDELPPLKAPKVKMCSHKMEEKTSSSSDSDECLDEDGLQGYNDRIMLELQRKQSHPRRLHPELWFNNTGEMNGGPLCRCSARARRHGMRHGVYAGELPFPHCVPTANNLHRLYHYRITVSPPTNFLIKAPTIIAHDEHEFLFSGFSMFSHYKLAKLPKCKVIRFNIEYTILYVEEPAPSNFSIRELDLFEEYLFYELLELVDLDLGKRTETSCSQFHFMPRFVRYLPEGGCEVLSMCEILKYLVDESGLLIPPDTLDDVHRMDHYSWQKLVDKIKGMIVTYPGKKPCSVRVDQLDRSPPVNAKDDPRDRKSYYPEIVHFGIRPPQLSYAGNPEYQKAWRYYVKYRHLIANMAKPTFTERQKLAAKEAKLQEMRTQSKMKRDVTVAISSEGFHTTGLMCDIVQHAMLIPVLVRHLRFHKSLESLEKKIGYVFKQRLLLQTALTHPSYRENFGTNPDHARNSLTNCGIRQPEYGDRRIHYTRKKGIVTLINIMSRFGKHSETESEIKHNERLEFLGDAVVEFLSSIHLFSMFPGLAEGGLATYRASIVQNQHLAQLAKNIDLEQFMLYAHGSDLCREVVMKHAMANCFEALMGGLFLDGGLEVADRVFGLALWYNEPDLLEVWNKERAHPLQEQEPLGDRKYIKDFEFLQKLTEFEESIGVKFRHIRLLARAFTDRSVGFTHLTLGSNQRLEFLGDTVLQLVVSDRLYRHFPDHHEGHLSLLRSSLVNNRTQSMVCDDLNMSAYAIYNNPKAKPTTKKHKADLLEAFLGALYVDKKLEYCQAFCNACLFPRLQEFIMNQDWNDPKSKLQQCCLTLRSMEGGEPDIPLYKVIECLGPTNTRVYTVGVYFRGRRLAAARGHSIQEAEMNAAEQALNCAHELFPQLDHQKRVIAKSLRRKRNKLNARYLALHPGKENSSKHELNDDRVPKAYRLGTKEVPEESTDTEAEKSDGERSIPEPKSEDDSGLSTEADLSPQLQNIEVSSLLNDMQKMKDEFIRRNEYQKLKEKCRRSDSDDD
ncbi:ribonuclease 3 [Epargyreus clarus]|uniref:ribonuclease 3 n=1 Tax=Epargyreus clarus TaxID=520877 RepID=UPI003C2EEC03